MVCEARAQRALKQTMSGGREMSFSRCSTCGSGLQVSWRLKRGKRSGELITNRLNTKERDQYAYSKSLMYDMLACSSEDRCTRLVTNHDQRQNPVLACEIRRRTHHWQMRPAHTMIMSRNGGVRQHHGGNALGGCNCNPLPLQKWLQIFEGVVYLSCVQMAVQHCDLGPWDLDDAGRRGGQALGIP